MNPRRKKIDEDEVDEDCSNFVFVPPTKKIQSVPFLLTAGSVNVKVYFEESCILNQERNDFSIPKKQSGNGFKRNVHLKENGEDEIVIRLSPEYYVTAIRYFC